MKYKIYELKSEKTDRIYIGLTSKTLSERYTKHRGHLKEDRNMELYHFIKENGLSIDDFFMELYQETNDRAEAFNIEGRRIKETSDINLNCVQHPDKIRNFSDAAKHNISNAMKGNKNRKGTKTTDEGKKNMSEAALRVKDVTCPFCGKIGKPSIMSRWHFDNCKYK